MIMSEPFAAHPMGAAGAIFRPVWQGIPSPFSKSGGDEDPDERSNDHEQDATTLFRQQLDETYRKGYEDGQVAMAELNAELIAASDRLAESVASLKPQPSDALCETLLRTIRTLLQNTAGFAAPDAETLKRHCASLAALAEKDCSNAILHIHPQDRMLLGDATCGLKLEDDLTLTRGTLSLAHSDGWIEQGTDPVLNELESMIEAIEAAR
jgi:flagellar assembly protein FliH